MKTDMGTTINIWKLYISRNPFKSLFRKIKYSIQRIKYGFCDWDTWDLDTYLSTMIPEALRKLARDTNGYPADFAIDDFEDEDAVMDKWRAELNKMADLIEEGGKSYAFSLDEYEGLSEEECKKLSEKKRENLKEGFRLLSEHFEDLWW